MTPVKKNTQARDMSVERVQRARKLLFASEPGEQAAAQRIDHLQHISAKYICSGPRDKFRLRYEPRLSEIVGWLRPHHQLVARMSTSKPQRTKETDTCLV